MANEKFSDFTVQTNLSSFTGLVGFQTNTANYYITTANFSNVDGQDLEIVDFENISIIQIQPFIVDKTGKIICQNAVIKQNINNCIVNQ